LDIVLLADWDCGRSEVIKLKVGLVGIENGISSLYLCQLEFWDEVGRWHGEPDARLLEGPGTLSSSKGANRIKRVSN
jgi:hypothetical protein